LQPEQLKMPDTISPCILNFQAAGTWRRFSTAMPQFLNFGGSERGAWRLETAAAIRLKVAPETTSSAPCVLGLAKPVPEILVAEFPQDFQLPVLMIALGGSF
jgi:hypothetical protein